jgi:hypothetical protein
MLGAISTLSSAVTGLTAVVKAVGGLVDAYSKEKVALTTAPAPEAAPAPNDAGGAGSTGGAGANTTKVEAPSVLGKRPRDDSTTGMTMGETATHSGNTWSDIGGEPDTSVVAEDGKLLTRTVETPQSDSDDEDAEDDEDEEDSDSSDNEEESGGPRWTHAASATLSSSCSHRVQVPEWADTWNINFGVAAASKDLSDPSMIWRDDDVWLLHCGDGNLFALGDERAGAGKVKPGSIICLEYDADAETLTFSCGKKKLGEHIGVTAPVKLIATLYNKGNALRLL